MRLEAAVGGALLTNAVLCSAAFGSDLIHGLHRRHVELHVEMERNPTPTVALDKRLVDVFNAPSGWPTVTMPVGYTLAGGVMLTPVPAMGPSSVSGSLALSSAMAVQTPAADPATWNAQAAKACMSAVTNLKGNANNPSGTVACYNVPFLNTTSGTFEAELRIFNVSQSTGDFVGVSQDNFFITLQYEDASLSANQNLTLPVKRSILEERQTTAQTTTNGVWAPVPLSDQKYLGQIDPTVLQPNMNTTQFKALLTPTIVVSATDPTTSATINTTLPLNLASFVAGVFSGTQGSLSNPSDILGNPLLELQAAAQGLPTPFVMPGVTLGVIPIGLGVTGAWLLVFSVVVGWGALGRMRMRENYRRAVKAQKDSFVKRI